MPMGMSLTDIPTEQLQAELARRSQTVGPPAFQFSKDWPETAVGLWQISTDGDCEGRTSRIITVEHGHLGELALKYAGHAMYQLTFKPVMRTQEEKPAESVHIQLDIKSGTWDAKGEDEQLDVMNAISAWLGPGFRIGPSNYHASYLLEEHPVGPGDKCPCCKGELLYLEDISSERLVGVEDGTLIIKGHYETSGWDKSPQNERLWCSNCGFEMPLPEQYDFVFG
jgi:uncharacterized protein YbaR (Trm112 family)